MRLVPNHAAELIDAADLGVFFDEDGPVFDADNSEASGDERVEFFDGDVAEFHLHILPAAFTAFEFDGAVLTEGVRGGGGVDLDSAALATVPFVEPLTGESFAAEVEAAQAPRQGQSGAAFLVLASLYGFPLHILKALTRVFQRHFDDGFPHSSISAWSSRRAMRSFAARLFVFARLLSENQRSQSSACMSTSAWSLLIFSSLANSSLRFFSRSYSAGSSVMVTPK